MPLTTEEFALEIAAIEKEVVDLTWIGALFEVPSFRQLYEKPNAHYLASREYLASLSFSEQKKVIVAISLLKLDLGTYLDLCEFALGLLEAGRISNRVFESIAFPTFDLDTKIVENYERMRVRSFLNSVLASAAIGTGRKEIIRQEILTGTSKAYVLDLRGAS